MIQEDEWLMSTLDRYEQLLMYELERPSHVLEWDEGGRSVWICGTTGQGSEINKLSLPNRLTASTLQAQRERDFRIECGALAPTTIACLKVLSQHQLLATADNVQVELWKKDPQSQDVLMMKQRVKMEDVSFKPSLLDWTPAEPNWLLAGDRAQPVVMDIDKNDTIFKPAHDTSPVHALCFNQDPGPTLIFVCTGVKGLVSVWDPRQPSCSLSAQSMPHDSDEQPESFAMDVGMSSCIATLSSTNRVGIFDIRALDKLAPAATGILGEERVIPNHKPCIQLAHGSERKLSVSGTANGGVAVYDFSSWSGSVSAPESLFHHRGHETESNTEAKVLAHRWHPTFPRLLLSTASDSSLHAWQYYQ